MEMAKDLNPVFTNFSADADAFMQKTDEETFKRIETVFEDLLNLRRSSREQAHILVINRIGVDKDEHAIRKQTANYCGLELHDDKDLP